MLKNISVSLENFGFHEFSITQPIVKLSGGAGICNSILSAIERCIAEDVSPYISKSDIEQGAVIDKVNTCHIKSDIADISISGNVQSLYSGGYYRVIRAYYPTVRIIQTPDTKLRKETGNVAYTVFSDTLSNADWLRLKKWVNAIANEEVVSIDLSSRTVSFKETGISPRVELAYMIYFEALAKVEPMCRKIFLLPDTGLFTSTELSTILSRIVNGNNVDTIIYSGDANIHDNPSGMSVCTFEL